MHDSLFRVERNNQAFCSPDEGKGKAALDLWVVRKWDERDYTLLAARIWFFLTEFPSPTIYVFNIRVCWGQLCVLFRLVVQTLGYPLPLEIQAYTSRMMHIYHIYSVEFRIFLSSTNLERTKQKHETSYRSALSRHSCRRPNTEISKRVGLLPLTFLFSHCPLTQIVLIYSRGNSWHGKHNYQRKSLMLLLLHWDLYWKVSNPSNTMQRVPGCGASR